MESADIKECLYIKEWTLVVNLITSENGQFPSEFEPRTPAIHEPVMLHNLHWESGATFLFYHIAVLEFLDLKF